MIASMSEKIDHISFSLSELSQTTTKLGVLLDARTKPHAPLLRIIRAPFTVIISVISSPAILPLN